ncbi:arfaptin-2 [Eurytemora carolleeae]|uniref:arfaptin-2 n=1 Tax=Eurytemora carolleeae TaxID=1294199 RepID=UPI000C758FD5|nr:arfaptin-2 [Eurytemora carolleeae]|eukprot:XP_023332974.1 arfaptin-2-like [Eurytemora affinis]
MNQGCAPVFQPFGEPVSTNIPLNTPSPGSKGTKLETIKNWTISTYKCSKQSLYEKLGKTNRTVDIELESQIEALRDTQRKYGNILRLARSLTSHFYHVVQTQSAMGECFSELAHKSPELQEEFLYNAETQRTLSKNGEHLLAALNFFVSSVNTLANKTMEDSILTVKQYETARVEFDAYKSDLDYYAVAPKTEINQIKMAETQAAFNNKKCEFEKLRSDVQIKLKFLDENRVKVMQKQLLLFHNAVSAYFSGNQAALESTMKQFAIKVNGPNSNPPSWIEK